MLNCEYCHTTQRKFYCTDCIKEKLQKHGEELDGISSERMAAITKAKAFVESAALIQQLIAEKNRRASQIESIQQSQQRLTLELNKKKAKVKEIQRRLLDKQKSIEEGFKRKSQYKQPFASSTVPDTSLLKAWQRTHKMTVGTRRILVKEVTSLFELKPGVIEEADLVASGMTLPQQQQHPVSKGTVENEIEAPPFSQTGAQMEAKEDLYICGVTLPTRLIDVSKYPKEELNAPVGLVIHMLGLIVRYLGIKLPFLIFHKETRPYIRMIPPNTPQLWDNYNKMPLFLEEDDKNFKRFVIGMAMLNYNLAYLCYTQNVKIPLSQVANTLQSLMACCRAPNLGLQSHTSCYHGIRDMNFPLEFQQVLRATTLRYRCSSQQQQVQQPLESSMVSSPSDEEYNPQEHYSHRRQRQHPLTHFLPIQHDRDTAYNDSKHEYLTIKKPKKRKGTLRTSQLEDPSPSQHQQQQHSAHYHSSQPLRHQERGIVIDRDEDEEDDEEDDDDDEETEEFEVEYHYYSESEDENDDVDRQKKASANDLIHAAGPTPIPTNDPEQQVRKALPSFLPLTSMTAATASSKSASAAAAPVPDDSTKNANETWSIVEVAPSFYQYYKK